MKYFLDRSNIGCPSPLFQLWMGLGNKPSSGFPIIRTWNNWINDFYLGREGLIFSPFWL
jgi:hypothetical protein